MVLDVAQPEALLTRTFSIGLDVGRGREKVALVRLRLSKALLGAAETQAMAAESLAIERGVATEQIAVVAVWSYGWAVPVEFLSDQEVSHRCCTPTS